MWLCPTKENAGHKEAQKTQKKQKCRRFRFFVLFVPLCGLFLFSLSKALARQIDDTDYGRSIKLIKLAPCSLRMLLTTKA